MRNLLKFSRCMSKSKVEGEHVTGGHYCSMHTTYNQNEAMSF